MAPEALVEAAVVVEADKGEVGSGCTAVSGDAAGDDFPGWQVFVSPLAGALLWPPTSWLLLLPQRRPAKEQTI